MQKFYEYLSIFLFLFISVVGIYSVVTAETDTLEGITITTAAYIEGVNTTDTIEGQVVTGGVANCPCYAGETLGWNGDHSLGANYACDSAGGDIVGTNNNLDTLDGNYLEYNAQDENLALTVDTSELASTGAWTVWFDVLQVTATGTGMFFEYQYNVDEDKIWIYSSDAGNIRVLFEGQNNGLEIVEHAGGISAADTWISCTGSWDFTNKDMFVECGGSGGDEDTDTALMLAFTAEPTTLYIGENLSSANTGTTTRIRNAAIISGYKTADPR